MLNLLALGIPAGGEWIIILVVVVLLFGGAKIPQLMRGVGKGVSEFQAGIKEGKRNFDDAMREASTDDEEKKSTSS